LTDSYGRKVDFRNTIVIMTSNVGVDMLKKKGSLGFKTVKEEIPYDEMRESLLEEIKKTFKPEFINRVDDIIVFRPLDKEALYKIVDNEINYVNARLSEQQIKVELTPEARDFFVDKGFDPVYGARPIRRVIQRHLEDPLAEAIIAGQFKEQIQAAGDGLAAVKLTVKNGAVELE